VALVTGAGSGIGAATARRLAAAGCDLALHTGQRADRLAAVAAACEAAGARVTQALGDLADPGLPAALVAAAGEAFGRLDVLVSNAGFADRRDIEALDPATLARSHEAMTGAFVRLATAVLPWLRASYSGRIVAVSSFVAHKFSLGGVAFPASAAAKAGLEAAALSLAARLAADGVTVNCVVPGYTRKDTGAHAALDSAAWRESLARIPMGRLGQPDDAAAAIAFLASPDAGYITGQRLHVDGGLLL
jgi:NAD(P)-dependent dehydrogenase (short-subunit alcohol dehydrogenase family)